MSAFAEIRERDGATRYWQALREHWLLITAIVVAAVGAAAAYSYTAEKRYESGADVLVTPVPEGDSTFIGIAVLRDSGFETRPVLTAARMIETPQAADAVKQRLNRPNASRSEILGAVEVTPLEQSGIVNVVGRGDDAREAADVANAFVDTLIESRRAEFQRDLEAVVERLSATAAAGGEANEETAAAERRLAQLRPLVGAGDPTLKVVSRAVPPERQAWPRPVLSIAVAFLAAMLLGTGLALALALLNPRVSREDELLLGQRLPILARVPRMRAKEVRGYLAGTDSLSGEVREAYRTLRTSLATAGPDGRFPSTVLVTSAIPGEGKTMTAVNLATTIAQAGTRVVLVDGDLRRPMVATVFGLPARHQGFATLLTHRTQAEDALVSAPGHRNLQLLLATPEAAALVDLLDPLRVEQALAALRPHADVIVIDSPPLTEVADALALADAADVVLVAVRLGRTRRDRLDELRRMLARRGVTPIGFVVTMRRRAGKGGYYYGSGASTAPPTSEPPAPVDADPVQQREPERV